MVFDDLVCCYESYDGLATRMYEVLDLLCNIVDTEIQLGNCYGNIILPKCYVEYTGGLERSSLRVGMVWVKFTS